MSREKIRGKKKEKKMRKHMLTACEAGHMSLFCPELPRCQERTEQKQSDLEWSGITLE